MEQQTPSVVKAGLFKCCQGVFARVFLYFLTYLLSYNIHTVTCTHLKCIAQLIFTQGVNLCKIKIWNILELILEGSRMSPREPLF